MVNPEWNQKFTFFTKELKGELLVKVYEKSGFLSSRCLGQATISLSDVRYGKIDRWFELTDGKEKSSKTNEKQPEVHVILQHEFEDNSVKSERKKGGRRASTVAVHLGKSEKRSSQKEREPRERTRNSPKKIAHPRSRSVDISTSSKVGKSQSDRRKSKGILTPRDDRSKYKVSDDDRAKLTSNKSTPAFSLSSDLDLEKTNNESTEIQEFTISSTDYVAPLADNTSSSNSKEDVKDHNFVISSKDVAKQVPHEKTKDKDKKELKRLKKEKEREKKSAKKI